MADKAEKLADLLSELRDEIKTLKTKVGELEASKEEVRWALQTISYDITEALAVD